MSSSNTFDDEKRRKAEERARILADAEAFIAQMESEEREVNRIQELEKIFKNPENDKNIQCAAIRARENWGPFITGVASSVANRSANVFPWSKLNPDQSVSFFLHRCSTVGCEECKACNPFEETLKSDFIIEQLDFQRKKFNYETIGDKKPLLEASPLDPRTNIIEYRFNLSPEQLDVLLKLNPQYAGYEHDRIIKLNKQFKMKPGFIRLFPVWPCDEKNYVMRATGCQIIEMPAIQLLHLMPNYTGPDKYFHWVPARLQNELNLNRMFIENIINSILLKYKMIEKHAINPKSDATVFISPNTVDTHGAIKIVDLDSSSQDFYLLYGNIGIDELQCCKSVEISVSLFLDEIKKFLQELEQKPFYKDDTDKLKSINASIVIVDQMLVNALRDEKLLTAASTASTTSSKDKKESTDTKSPLGSEKSMLDTESLFSKAKPAIPATGTVKTVPTTLNKPKH